MPSFTQLEYALALDRERHFGILAKTYSGTLDGEHGNRAAVLGKHELLSMAGAARLHMRVTDPPLNRNFTLEVVMGHLRPCLRRPPGERCSNILFHAHHVG